MCSIEHRQTGACFLSVNTCWKAFYWQRDACNYSVQNNVMFDILQSGSSNIQHQCWILIRADTKQLSYFSFLSYYTSYYLRIENWNTCIKYDRFKTYHCIYHVTNVHYVSKLNYRHTLTSFWNSLRDGRSK